MIYFDLIESFIIVCKSRLYEYWKCLVMVNYFFYFEICFVIILGFVEYGIYRYCYLFFMYSFIVLVFKEKRFIVIF